MYQAKNITAIRWLPCSRQAIVYFHRNFTDKDSLYKKGLITKEEYKLNSAAQFFKVRIDIF